MTLARGRAVRDTLGRQLPAGLPAISSCYMTSDPRLCVIGVDGARHGLIVPLCICKIDSMRGKQKRRQGSMVRDQWRQGRGFHVLLLHELAAVQDNTRHRRKLRREPILPHAIDAADAPFLG
jgi:hypothetical protein